jgi:hypothetical protein
MCDGQRERKQFTLALVTAYDTCVADGIILQVLCLPAAHQETIQDKDLTPSRAFVVRYFACAVAGTS